MVGSLGSGTLNLRSLSLFKTDFLTLKYVGFFYKYQGGGAGFWCVFFGLMRMLDGVWEVGLGCGADGMGGWDWLAELPGRRMGLVGGVAFQVRNGRTRSIVSDEQTAE
ncbi:MAG: hypothetical protein DA446_05165 [Bacteroidetes bacterium]|nr:MAG: hypothetical protein DA446_05165 [Bacteroidota bacterium]